MLNSVGERHVPRGTPLRSVNGGPVRWEMRMEAVLSVKKFERMRVKEGCMLRRSILCLSPSCQTLSKALETSRRIMFVDCVFYWGLEVCFMKTIRKCSIEQSLKN